MGSGLDTAARWLETATAGIPFGPDRRAVRRELEEHLEDKARDLQRIFPDLTREAALERACAGMGDAAEVGRALARVHRPWLGYLWRASQVLLALALVWLAVVVIPLAWGQLAPREQEAVAPDWTYEAEIPFSCGEPVRAGSYTLQVEGSLNFAEGDTVGGLLLTWRAASPLVWERPTSHLYWWGEDDLGNLYYSHEDLGQAIYVAGTDRYVSSTTWERDGLGWTGQSQVWNVPREAKWVRLILDVGEAPITILLEREGETA